jgi:hypothetical protein
MYSRADADRRDDGAMAGSRAPLAQQISAQLISIRLI